jgi:hypothetical protein
MRGGCPARRCPQGRHRRAGQARQCSSARGLPRDAARARSRPDRPGPVRAPGWCGRRHCWSACATDSGVVRKTRRAPLRRRRAAGRHHPCRDELEAPLAADRPDPLLRCVQARGRACELWSDAARTRRYRNETYARAHRRVRRVPPIAHSDTAAADPRSVADRRMQQPLGSHRLSLWRARWRGFWRTTATTTSPLGSGGKSTKPTARVTTTSSSTPSTSSCSTAAAALGYDDVIARLVARDGPADSAAEFHNRSS